MIGLVFYYEKIIRQNVLRTNIEFEYWNFNLMNCYLIGRVEIKSLRISLPFEILMIFFLS